MVELTPKQREILEFIPESHAQGVSPSYREIAAHFGYRSVATVADHVELLRRKGMLEAGVGQARSFKVVTPLQRLCRQIVHIPLFGSIPAGPPEEKQEEAAECISVDIGTLNIRPNPRLFALRVQGDSMIGKHIISGDIVILEHGREPRHGQVVAALIDGESTLKTYVLKNGKAFLKAENPKYPDLIPAQELVIQGVFVSLIRQGRQ